MNNFLFEYALLIEDDPSHALLVKRALKDYVGQVAHAATLKEGLDSASAKKPDLIITDLNLPDVERLENVAQLHSKYADTPLVVLTSSTSLGDAVEAMKLGARDFIVKNFDASFREILGLALSRLWSAEELARETRRLEGEMSALRQAIENSQDALAVTRGTKIVYANHSFESFVRLCGGTVESLGSLFSLHVEHSDSLSESLLEKAASLSPGAVWHTEVGLVSNRSRAFDLSLSVIRSSADSTQNECVLWVRDISEQKRREKFQREILSTTTHDLKGPLGAIALSAELLSGPDGSETRNAEIVKRIASSAASAINLIDEFLSARRIQEGTYILKPHACDVSALCLEALQNFEPLASVKAIKCTLEPTVGSVNWTFDRVGILRVISNLVSNAIKFTPKGGKIIIRISIISGELHIAVSDTGSGMEPAEVNKIFERFTRLEKHADIPGTGIGLFVVKSIVVAHGGRVDVVSQPGAGTTFEVVLPEKPPVNERGELISLDFA